MNLFFTSDLHLGHANIMKYSHRPGLTSEETELLALEDADNAAFNTKLYAHKADLVDQGFKDWAEFTKDDDVIWHNDLSDKVELYVRAHRPKRRFNVSKESVKRMNDYLIENINATVGVNDVLWHLGDFCFDVHSYQKFRDAIKCKTVNHVWGNHDDYQIKNAFNATHDLKMITWDNQQIVLCHYAMAIWNKSHHKVWHLYGHSHSGAEEKLELAFPGRRSMDVGVDNAIKLLGSYRPFSFKEVRKILIQKSGCAIDHHI